MNSRKDNPQRNEDFAALDRILAGEDALVPSSGFASKTMERVREEAAAPPSIPFPWKRAVFGMALAIGVFGWGTFELAQAALPALRNLAAAPPAVSVTTLNGLVPAGWVALALVISLLSWLLARRIAGGSGIL